MRRRSRLLRVAKWGGVVVCAALTQFFSCMALIDWNPSYGDFWMYLDSGNVNFRFPGDPLASAYHVGPARSIGYVAVWDDYVEFSVLRVPLVLIFIAVVAPTALLFCCDRRTPPGHCPCGYDLTGNVSGTCPECGVEGRSE